ncbi:MAG: TauD/TfdA family dioxygenase [Methylovirgula sp.]
MGAAHELGATLSLLRGSNAFDLDDDVAYRVWRDSKLELYPSRAEDLWVEIRDPNELTSCERTAISERCLRGNMALYAFPANRTELETRRNLKALSATFGLSTLEDHRSAEADGIVRIEVVQSGGRLGYIPYSDRPISWHTDGYYNFKSPAHYVGAMLMHCVRSADEGGDNRLLDPEIAYIRLRDLDPAHIDALMHPAAMRIPANFEDNGQVRAENVGPVFFVDSNTGTLGMRYTARKRNIAWRDDEQTRRAVSALEHVLETDPLVLRLRLQPGQGLICNNVLHDRSAFAASDDGGRLLFRVRYRGRIRPTAT